MSKYYNAVTGEPIGEEDNEPKYYNAVTGEPIATSTSFQGELPKKKKKSFGEAAWGTLVNSVQKKLESLNVFARQTEQKHRKSFIEKGTADYSSYLYDEFRNKAVLADKESRKAQGLPARNFLEYMFPIGDFEKKVRKGYDDYYRVKTVLEDVETANHIQKIKQHTKNVEELQEGYNGFGKAALNITAGVAETVPTLGLCVLTQSPIPMIMQAAPSGFASGYGTIVEAGGSHEDSVFQGMIEGSIDTATSWLGTKNLVAIGKGAFKDVAKQTVKGAVFETAIDTAGGVVKGIPEAILIDKATNKIYASDFERGTSIIERAGKRGALEGVMSFFASSPFRVVNMIAHTTKPPVTKRIGVEAAEELGFDSAEQYWHRTLEREELAEMAAMQEEVPNLDNPDSIRNESLIPEEGAEQHGYDSLDYSNLKDIKAAADLREVVNLGEDVLNGEVIKEPTQASIPRRELTLKEREYFRSNVLDAKQARKALEQMFPQDIGKRLSLTATNTLHKYFSYEQIAEMLADGADFYYIVNDNPNSITKAAGMALAIAEKKGNVLEIQRAAEVLVEVGSKAGKELQELQNVYKYMQETGDIIGAAAKKLAQENKKIKIDNNQLDVEKKELYDINQKLVDNVKEDVAKKIEEDTRIKKDVEISSDDLRKTVDKHVTGLKAPKQSSKQRKLNLRKAIEDWVSTGRKDLDTAIDTILKEYWGVNTLEGINETDLASARRIIGNYLNEGFNYQADHAAKHYQKLIEKREQENTDAYMDRFKRQVNRATLVDNHLFNQVIDKFLPANIKKVMTDNNIILADYVENSQIKVQSLVNDIYKKAYPHLDSSHLIERADKQVYDSMIKMFTDLSDEMLLNSRKNILVNMEKHVLGQLKKDIKGVKGLSPETSKKIADIDPWTFKRIFKEYYQDGGQKLQKVKERIKEHYKSLGILREDELQAVDNMLEAIVHKNIKETRETFKKSLHNKNRFIEPLTDAEILAKEEEFFNAGAFFDDRTFKTMIEHRIPRAIKNMLVVRGIDLKDYMFGSQLEKQVLIDELTTSFGKVTDRLPRGEAEAIAESIQDNILHTIKEYEIKKRKQLERGSKKTIKKLVNTMRTLVEYGGLSEEAIQNFVDHKNGKLVLTQKDYEVLRLKQEQMKSTEINSEERRSLAYDVKYLLESKIHAGKKLRKRLSSALVTYNAGNLISGYTTAVVNVISNVLRPTKTIGDLYINAGVQKIFGKGNEAYHEAQLYTQSYLNSFSTIKNIFFNKELNAAINTFEKSSSDNPKSVLDMVHELAYNKRKYISLAVNRVGYDVSEGINTNVNTIGASFWGLDSQISNLGKLADIAGELFNVLTFDTMAVIDSPAKHLAFNAKVEADLRKHFYNIGMSEAEQEVIVDKLTRDIKHYIDGSNTLKGDEAYVKLAKQVADDGIQFANEMTFQQDVFREDSESRFWQGVYKAAASDWGRILLNPFVKTPINVTKYGVKMFSDPLKADAGIAIKFLRGKDINKLEVASALSKTISGGIALVGFYGILNVCSLDEVYSKNDKGKSEEGLPIGYKLRLPNGAAINLSIVEPYGKLLIFAREMTRIGDYFNDTEKGIVDKFLHFAFTVMNDCVSGDMTRGYMDVINSVEKASEGSAEGLGKYFNNKLTSFFPYKSFFKKLNTLPEQRESLEALLSLGRLVDEFNMVYNPKEVPYKLSRYSGKVITNPDTTLFAGVTVEATEIEDRVLTYVQRSGIKLPTMPREFRGVELDAKQYYNLLAYMGNNFNVSQIAEDRFIGSEQFSSLPRKIQQQKFSEVMNSIYKEIFYSWARDTGFIDKFPEEIKRNAEIELNEQGIDVTESFSLFEKR